METQTVHPDVAGGCPWDFMRCAKCGRLHTQLEMRERLGPQPTVKGCACGSAKFSPANLTWTDWRLPRVWVFALARLRGTA